MGRKSSTASQLLCSFLFLSCVLFLLGGSCWWLLRNGMAIDRLAVAGMEFRQLSLRLDQGLVIRVGQLDLPGETGEEKSGGWESRLLLLENWGHLVQEIDIRSLSWRGQAASLTYRDGLFKLRSDQLAVEAALAYSEKTVWLNLIDLQITPYRLTVAGHGSYSPASNSALFSGKFAHPLGRGSFCLTQEGPQVSVAVSTNDFPQLAPVLGLFPLDPRVTAWVADNITAASYQIKDLRLRFNLDRPQEFGPENISGTAVADAVAIRFQPELEPVRCDRVHITFAADRLSFALDNPRYRSKSLQGSSVYIDNVIAEGSTLGIDLLAETAKDREVDEILEKFAVNFPARQVSGTSRVDLRLLFDLSDFTMAASGVVSAGSGTWTWREIPLQTKGITVQLLNNRVHISQADLAVGNVFRAQLSGLFDIENRHGDLQCNIDSLVLARGDATLIQATGVLVPLTVDFSREGAVAVKMPELQAALHLDRERTDIDLDSLRAVAPYAPLLNRVGFTDGKVHLTLKEPGNVQFAGEIDIPNSLLSLQDQPVSKFRFEGTSTPQATDLALNDNSIIISWSDQVTVNLNGYLLTLDTNKYTGKQVFSTPVPLKIIGARSLLQVKNQLIPTGRFELRAQGSDLSFQAELKKGNFVYAVKGGDKTLVGRGLDADLVSGFLKNADLTGGTMNVFLKFRADDTEGYLEMDNILIRDTKLLNNILAFLNAVPALATLSSPGFNLDGYRVNDGVAYLHYRNNILTIDVLRTDGVAINTEAKGWIDNAHRTLSLTMELITLKDYSKILEKIPLAGYAILGENGTLSTSLDIQGSLDHPQITTNLTREILLSPINIIKRTIEWPFRVFDQLNGKDQDAPEPE